MQKERPWNIYSIIGGKACGELAKEDTVGRGRPRGKSMMITPSLPLSTLSSLPASCEWKRSGFAPHTCTIGCKQRPRIPSEYPPFLLSVKFIRAKTQQTMDGRERVAITHCRIEEKQGKAAFTKLFQCVSCLHQFYAYIIFPKRNQQINYLSTLHLVRIPCCVPC